MILARFTKRERIADASLCKPIEDAERGLVEADLGGGLIKQRVARKGQGKSGGYRMLIGFRSKLRAHASGIMNDAAYEKITLRHLKRVETAPAAAPLTGDDIRAIREHARMSQAVFAQYLNLTVGYVSQLERGAKRPTGAALVLLNVIRRKGIEAIL
jgi:putative transcriptional regulator